MTFEAASTNKPPIELLLQIGSSTQSCTQVDFKPTPLMICEIQHAYENKRLLSRLQERCEKWTSGLIRGVPKVSHSISQASPRLS